MTRRRPEDFDLKAAIASVSFTPGERDFAALVGLFAEEDDQLHGLVERAMLRAGKGALEFLTEHSGDERPPVRARVCRLLGRFFAEPPEAGEAAQGATGAKGDPRALRETLRDTLMARLSDEDARTRRYAVGALSKSGTLEADPEIEGALLAVWGRETDLSVKRALAAALGKVGGARALSVLEAAGAGPVSDAELERIRGEALLRLSRRKGGGVELRVEAGRVLEKDVELVLRCRLGLETIMRDEAAAKTTWQPRVVAPGEVRGVFVGALESLFRVRTALSFGFALAPEMGELGTAVARALSSDKAWEIIKACSPDEARYRIAWAGGGKKRAAVFSIAEAVSKRRPALLNDPANRNWEAVVYEERQGIQVELRPRLDDPRFAYRVGDVPAASHPTLAAALARLAGARLDDVVWDPFCGSGTELAERALLGPFRELYASDVDAAALAMAHANLKSVGVEEIARRQGDSLAFAPPGVTLIITNPPMGRRVLRHEDLAAFFDRFVDHAARSLAPGGRLVFISPLGPRTRARAVRAGLEVTFHQLVDMGGFDAEIQVMHKRAL